MSFHQRLKEARLQKGYTQQYVADQIGVAKSTYSGYESGFREPDVIKIKRLIDVLECSSSYLLGDGTKPPAHQKSKLSADQAALLRSYRRLDAHGRQVIAALLKEEEKRMDDLEASIESTEMVVYNFPAAAGIPLYVEDDSYERIEFSSSKVPKGADFGIRISGDSMEPTIEAGAIVFVRKTAELRPGEIGIFMLDDEAVCKRFSADNNGFLLVSDNEAYEDVAVKGHQRFAIIGKVLGYK